MVSTFFLQNLKVIHKLIDLSVKEEKYLKKPESYPTFFGTKKKSFKYMFYSNSLMLLYTLSFFSSPEIDLSDTYQTWHNLTCLHMW